VFDLNDEMLGRMEFDRYRQRTNKTFVVDWADLSRTEKERWIEAARTRLEVEGT
jgi:hypothetical protein